MKRPTLLPHIIKMNFWTIRDLDGKDKKNVLLKTARAKIYKCELGSGLLEMTQKVQSRLEYIKSPELKTWSPKKEKSVSQVANVCKVRIWQKINTRVQPNTVHTDTDSLARCGLTPLGTPRTAAGRLGLRLQYAYGVPQWVWVLTTFCFCALVSSIDNSW